MACDPLTELPGARCARILRRPGLRALHDATPRAVALLSVFIIPPNERIL